MNDRFVLAPQPTLKRVADLDGPDFYPTPEWATLALLENETFGSDIWESACGDGAMSRVIQEFYPGCESSDLYDRGFGEPGVDYITAHRKHDHIVTNPPFHSAEPFVAAGLRNAKKKFALLLRLAFLEGAGRQKTIFDGAAPSRVWIFSERITFYPRGAQKKGSGTTAYAWFVWDRSHSGPTELKWLPVGVKKRRPDIYEAPR
ncbi:hypothetical protein [Palleronia pelagia]|uniref:Methyltransferase n=1 Tax=Palleronia pelagia TaxID=387096 RepID=A0A1H8ATM9_9RHOB|nr:hypothetical protein [Palleronia pelagia]SEM72867.1 hypothetical protein SAMN04488011_101261 [Palleronia pelagia]